MFSKILVGTDGSETGGRAVEQAAELAKSQGAELIVLHAAPTRSAVPDMGYMAAVDPGPVIEEGRRLLADVQAKHVDDARVRTLLREGDAAEAILDAAEEEGADLIVVGNRGMRGAKRFLLGSVPNRVAHHSPCSVLIVHTT
jgi:nucleotide-binding universal stress UspA family protein